MSSFSERMGYKPIKKIQIKSMDNALKIRLWNALKNFYWDKIESRTSSFLRPYSIILVNHQDCVFLTRLWDESFKKPLNEISDDDWSAIYKKIITYFNNFEWHQVYDFIEFIAKKYPKVGTNKQYMKNCNSILEEEVSGYRFVGGRITPITSEIELSAIEEALKTPLKPVNNHIKNALVFLSDRDSPNYENSVKESISAVESICKIIISDENATLGQCLNKIEREGKIPIHGALKSAFSTLYGYTSSEEGIRHGSIRDSEVDFDIAKFMLVSCSAFVNYLVSKSSEAGIRLSIHT